jgi:hypothetical protein
LSTSIATNPTENLLKKFILRTAGLVALLSFFGGGAEGQSIANYTFYRLTSGTLQAFKKVFFSNKMIH